MANKSFGGLKENELPKEPRFSILPVPFDITTSYVGGTDRGPAAIIEASANMELYDEELNTEPYLVGIETLPEIKPASGGIAVSIVRVREAVEGILEAGRIPVILGGEHSITAGAIEALADIYPSLSVLHLDAHADMRDTYKGEHYSHACAARRISELCPIVQVGIRSMSKEEAALLSSNDTPNPVRTFYAGDLLKEGGFDPEAIAAELSEEVYITIDLDVFDPAIMPSTGTPEPGGLSWQQVTAIVRAAAAKRRIVGFDAVELSPIKGLPAPDFLTARLVYRLIGYISESGKSLL